MDSDDADYDSDSALLPRAFTWEAISDWAENNFNLIFVKTEEAIMWVFGDSLGEMWNAVEVFIRRADYEIHKWLHPEYYEDLNHYCIDEDGLHFMGETWQNKGKCNSKTCVAHHAIKELRCGEVPEKKGCEVVKGSVSKAWPDCCDRSKCEPYVEAPSIPQPVVSWLDFDIFDTFQY